MRHHNRKIFPSRLPCNESSDAVDVKTTLTHVEKLHQTPIIQAKSAPNYVII